MKVAISSCERRRFWIKCSTFFVAQDRFGRRSVTADHGTHGRTWLTLITTFSGFIKAREKDAREEEEPSKKQGKEHWKQEHNGGKTAEKKNQRRRVKKKPCTAGGEDRLKKEEKVGGRRRRGFWTRKPERGRGKTNAGDGEREQENRESERRNKKQRNKLKGRESKKMAGWSATARLRLQQTR